MNNVELKMLVDDESEVQAAKFDRWSYLVGWNRVGFERAFRSIAPSLRQAMAKWCLGVFAVGTLGSVIR